MVLDLANKFPKGSNEYQLHTKVIDAIIVHQFGHALGLGHALMDDKTRQILNNYVDKSEIAKSFGLNAAEKEFEELWEGREAHIDNKSVMLC